MANFVRHTPCDSCQSSDAGAIYDDGGFYCHKCGLHKKENGEVYSVPEVNALKMPIEKEGFIKGIYLPLTSRRISKETCELFKYQHGVYRGQDCTIGNCFNPKTGQLVAQKIRLANKDFPWEGDPKEAGLFGQQLCGKGKRIVITEGFEDAMAVSEVFNNKWPAVSLLNGTDTRGTGPKKELLRQLEWLNGFEQIVLLFDMDEPGQIAAIEAAKVLPMGRVFIAYIQEKDADDMLKAGKGQELMAAIWNAKPYIPDGLVDKQKLREDILKKRELSKVTYPFFKLNEMTYGIRPQELITIAGGSGLGKSTYVRQIANHLISQGEKVGFITLEEDAEFTSKCLIGQRIGKNARLIEDMEKEIKALEILDNTILPSTEWYDDQGGLTKERLRTIIEFMVLAQGVKWIVYDHITMTDKSDGDTMVEALDSTMKILRSLAQRLKITIFIITQLAKPQEGLGYNEGRIVKLSNIRGSAAIEFNSNIIIAFQGDSRDGNCTRETVVLKNRYYGVNTGHADNLIYDPKTDLLMIDSGFNKETEEF